MMVFNIATVPRRKKMFLSVLRSLASQTLPCDHINVAMGYPTFDEDIYLALKKLFKSHHIKYRKGLQCEYKLFALDSTSDEAQMLTFDDDIIYPPDYAHALISGLENHGGVVGFHGIRFKGFPVKNYKAEKTMYQYFKDVGVDTQVHVIGTGCMGFNVGQMRQLGLTFEKINTKSNCLDGSFGRWCRDNGIKTTVLAHAAGWMGIMPESQDLQSLWKKSWAERYKTKLSFLEK